MPFSIKPDNIKAQSAVILSCSSSLKGYAGDIRAVADDLNSSLAELRPSLEAIAANAETSSAVLERHSEALINIANAYSQAENNVLAQIGSSTVEDDELNGTECAADGDEAFDDNGLYGGRQGNIKEHTNVAPFSFWFIGTDNYLYEFVKKHEGYEDYTNDQIKELFDNISSGGCGWVALANMIMSEFEGRPEEFEKTFGFPMYKNGDLNFDQLVIDLYTECHGKYYIDDDLEGGKNDLYNGIRNHYKEYPDEFKAKYGIDLLDENGKVTDAAKAKIIEERDALVNDSDMKCVYYEDDPYGTFDDNRAKRVTHYLEERGITSITYENGYGYTDAQLKEAIDSGKTVVIGMANYTLYDMDGNPVKEHGSNHSVVVTDITPEGDYIVSSWGRKLVYHPNENTRSNGKPTTKSVEIYDIYPQSE